MWLLLDTDMTWHSLDLSCHVIPRQTTMDPSASVLWPPQVVLLRFPSTIHIFYYVVVFIFFISDHKHGMNIQNLTFNLVYMLHWIVLIPVVCIMASCFIFCFSIKLSSNLISLCKANSSKLNQSDFSSNSWVSSVNWKPINRIWSALLSINSSF